jgi:signal transduction histidine kinase
MMGHSQTEPAAGAILPLSDCFKPMTAPADPAAPQNLASAQPWTPRPAALFASLALGAALGAALGTAVGANLGTALGAAANLLAPAAALAGLLLASAAIAWQTHQLQAQRRELELIGQLLRCLNPHLGLQHSADRMLQLTQQFFGASQCHLDLPDPSARDRAVRLHEPPEQPEQPDALERISVALPWQQRQAHLQLSSRRAWSGRERRMLERVAHLAYAPLERIGQLEQLSAQAGERERQRLGLDLHDRVMQPYIGLKLALEALQSRQGQALAAGLQSLVAMTEQVIDGLRGDLRRLGPGTADAPARGGARLATTETDHPTNHQATDPAGQLADELAQQARLMHQLHGVSIAVRGPVPAALSQRLRQEVSQFIREGLSNIRRHTLARAGEIELRCDGQQLGLRISNEGLAARGDFAPRSISQRARALGGWSEVRSEEGQRTAVHVTIPL